MNDPKVMEVLLPMHQDEAKGQVVRVGALVTIATNVDGVTSRIAAIRVTSVEDVAEGTRIRGPLEVDVP